MNPNGTLSQGYGGSGGGGGEIFVIGGIAIANAISNAITSKPPRVEHPDAEAENKAYKEAYKQPPPPDQDPCEKLKWQLAREKALLAARMAWDAKWGPHHSAAIIQSQSAISNLETKIKNTPGCTCP